MFTPNFTFARFEFKSSTYIGMTRFIVDLYRALGMTHFIATFCGAVDEIPLPQTSSWNALILSKIQFQKQDLLD